MKIRCVEFFHLVMKDWRWQLGIVFVVLLTMGLLQDFSQPTPTPLQTSHRIEIDQYTPLGHSLVPMQLLNQESLLSIIGPTAVLNLYRPDDNQLVAADIKVVRAPQSPETLVAIVPESLVASVARAHDQLVGVLKNPSHQHGTNFVYQKAAVQRKIHYGQDSK